MKLRLTDSIRVLLLALSISFPFIFWNAFKFSLPMGYAGMFTLMAEMISENDFNLPFYIPHYGPGGVPFSYPPLGLYILAAPIFLTGKTLVFLRFLPPLFSLLALIPLFYLACEVSGSKLAGFTITVLAGLSVELYIPHTWSAGVVRAPAFGFCLLSLLFYLRVLKSFSWRYLILAGVAFGLTVLTHLSYSMFVVLWIISWTIFHPKKINWLIGIGIALIGSLIIFPWLGIILPRFGMSVLKYAFDSHGNTDVFNSLLSFRNMLSALQLGLMPVLKSKLLTSLIGMGIIFQLLNKKLALPAEFFVVTFFMADGERFVFLAGFFLAGIAVFEISTVIGNLVSRANRSISLGFVGVFVIGIIITFGYQNFEQINKISPRLDSNTLKLGQYFKESTQTDETYLPLVPQDEAEWMPYLFRRQPIVAQWGSEWLGTYDEQTYRMLQVRACHKKDDLLCLEEFFSEVGIVPDYLVTLRRDKKIREILLDDMNWEYAHENERYFVWRRID